MQIFKIKKIYDNIQRWYHIHIFKTSENILNLSTNYVFNT